MKKYLWFIGLASIGFCSCTGSIDSEASEIMKYIQSQNTTFIDTLGVWVQIDDRGQDTMKDGSKLLFEYEGSYLDESFFDKSTGATNNYIQLNSLIKGLRSGLKVFGKNGKGIILIPSESGFGANPPRGLRENASLIYNVTITDFK